LANLAFYQVAATVIPVLLHLVSAPIQPLPGHAPLVPDLRFRQREDRGCPGQPRPASTLPLVVERASVVAPSLGVGLVLRCELGEHCGRHGLEFVEGLEEVVPGNGLQVLRRVVALEEAKVEGCDGDTDVRGADRLGPVIVGHGDHASRGRPSGPRDGQAARGDATLSRNGSPGRHVGVWV
jgi:hypothetical protein